MKTIAFTLAAGLLFSGATLAAQDANPDLYGSVHFDKGAVSTTVQRGSGDTYGSVLLDPAPTRETHRMAFNANPDLYGCILSGHAN